MKEHCGKNSDSAENPDISSGLGNLGKTVYLEEREEEAFSRLQRLIVRLGVVVPAVFDVGANVGQSVEKFRQAWPGAEIHSFEPNPSPFSTLSGKWGNTPGIVLNNVALSDFNGTSPFHATRISEVASLLSPTERMRRISVEHKYDYEVISVHTETLDNYCRALNCKKIDILKIDVQGAELNVLRGARSLLQRGMISAIYVETTFAACYEGQANYSGLMSYLGRFSYELWDISPFLYTSRDRLWAANSIFLSKTASESLEI